MTSNPSILITGARGEIGLGLIEALAQRQSHTLIALDLLPLNDNERLAALCDEVITGDILDNSIIDALNERNIVEIYHLAALLSTKAEKVPDQAQAVNVSGTQNLIHLAQTIGKRRLEPVKFLFPSSIAVYGIHTLDLKRTADRVSEDRWNAPETMYGVNKLQCEHLGRYYAEFIDRADSSEDKWRVDFRALRFPGLISAFTVPSGGTSDYASEMLHHAAQNKAYECFVRETTQIPFMAMPDAVRALLELAQTPAENLSRRTYNIGAFAPTASEIAAKTRAVFPNFELIFKPNALRQAIVDSWPLDVDDAAARSDWGWRPEFDFDSAFDNYLIPNIKKYYEGR